MTWIIVSNRLPFGKDKNGKLVPSSGGLVSAISGINSKHNKIWIGTAPEDVTEQDFQNEEMNCYKPVFIDYDTYDGYYNGISNGVIWPVFHYEGSMLQFSWGNWEKYVEVNKKIAEVIAETATEQDIVWIHDFHLFLVPKFLRKLRPEIKIGFFLHIPFPSSEVFRQLPPREEILEGVLESDLIGFQDYSYLRHFCNSCQHLLGINTDMLSINYKNRKINLGVFPVSIDSEKFIEKSKSPEVSEILEKYNSEKNYQYLLLGVDRLDYIKGLVIRLKAFKELLLQFPDLRGKISFLQIAVPTRQDVNDYIELKSKLENMISEINGEFGRPNYVPVQYIYSSVDFNELVALYKLADVLMVTSRRDGMNLVALEYIVSQDEYNPGVVLLSEFAGASSVLSHAISINPWDIENTAKKIIEAIDMEKTEKVIRNRHMLNYLKKYNASSWAESFIENLTKMEYPSERQKLIFKDGVNLPEEFKLFNKSDILIFLDYDGTLVPICNKPEQAVISNETFNSLKSILKNINIVIVSGRNSEFLREQFKDLEINIAAEHGSKFYSSEKKEWLSLVLSNKESWMSSVIKTMNDYASRVPESIVEVKEYSVAWHYRLSPPEFASYQSRKLKEELEAGLANLPVTILAGNKIIEAKAIEANKGFFIKWYLETQKNKKETIIAIGDDFTDEEMFAEINNIGISIKVGNSSNSIAKYKIKSQEQVLQFLKMISEKKEIIKV